MAITTGSRIRISLTQEIANQRLMNVWDYVVLELAGIPTAGNYAEAWWNHVKTNYRAISPSAWGNAFLSVRVSELGNPEGEYGEYAIPTGERAGTRSTPTDSDAMPTYAAVGVRLAVASRLTRPGQKRFGHLTQSDIIGNAVQSGITGIINTLMGTMTSNMTLGAPAAGVVLVPAIVSLNADGTIRTHQVVTGFAISPNATTQVSRKIGRGI